ncbi:MAG: hypothetical protein LBH87_02830 [Coriobacteriales bacterium]|jgi:hypothetical protein|nr:hypothetical protein [Coriobacteriales bacterium]
MTKLTIDPGVCGFITKVEAVTEDGMEVKLSIESDCPGVGKLVENLGDTFNAFDICMKAPGDGPLYDYAREHFPHHGACPSVAGITKAIEAECSLALPRNVSFTFED